VRNEFERLDVYFTKITSGSNSLRRMAYKVYRRSQSVIGYKCNEKLIIIIFLILTSI